MMDSLAPTRETSVKGVNFKQSQVPHHGNLSNAVVCPTTESAIDLYIIRVLNVMCQITFMVQDTHGNFLMVL